MIIKIITHPGEAHFDEFFAICLILATQASMKTEFRVERRDPTEEELNDSNIWVVDVGKQCNFEMKNFDHHQSSDLPCSYVLVAQHLGIEDKLKDIPWWSGKNDLDVKGPSYVAKKIGIDTNEFLSLISPLEKFLLEKFESGPSDEILSLMLDFGLRVLKNAEKFLVIMKYYNICPVIEVEGKKILINESFETFASERFAEKHDIAVMVSYDKRGDGWAIHRFFDNPNFDFTNLNADERVEFSHKNGFHATTKEKISTEELLELIKKGYKK